MSPSTGIRLLFLFLVTLACAGERALVERFEQGDWKAAPFQVVSMGGQYAAPRVVFVLRLEEPNGSRLIVEGTVEIDPMAKLVEGRWVEEGGSSPRTGTLSSEAVDYFGGQGGRVKFSDMFQIQVQ